jgi:hypothetical protein
LKIVSMGVLQQNPPWKRTLSVPTQRRLCANSGSQTGLVDDQVGRGEQGLRDGDAQCLGAGGHCGHGDGDIDFEADKFGREREERAALTRRLALC